MKRLILLSVFLISSFNILLAQDEDQKELIKNVIQSAYVDGLCNNADTEAVNKGFHPGFILLGVGNGNVMWSYPIYSWIENAKNGKKKGLKYSFQNEFTTIKFLFIDVSGTAAVAKIEFFEGNELYSIDYLSLLKFEDGWKIVSKIFHSIPKEKK
ncbi:MAG: hypothetical protein EHM93_10125 [Bacteroidales bacterium]|nr:MAG: hypothetical protein EHM93_10125 [Bacteroidales bacterium]